MKMQPRLELEEEEIRRMFSPGAIDHINIGYINQLINEALELGRAEADIACAKSHSAKVETLRDSLGIANQKILKYEDVIGRLENEIKSLEAGLSDEIDQHQKTYASLRESSNVDDHRIKAKNGRISDLKEKLKISDNAFQMLSTATGDSKGKIESLENENKSLSESLEAAVQRIETKDDALTFNNKEIKSLKKDLHAAYQEAEIIRSENESLKLQISSKNIHLGYKNI